MGLLATTNVTTYFTAKAIEDLDENTALMYVDQQEKILVLEANIEAMKRVIITLWEKTTAHENQY